MATDPSIITRDLNELSKETGNVYESVVVISRRARQVATQVKQELTSKLAEFALPLITWRRSSKTGSR
jgi:DNA-directed RNA polymerase subunit K/omega